MNKGEKVASLAIAVNIGLFGIKYFFAVLSGSIAMRAGAFDAFTDVVASSAVFIGLMIASRKTRNFPYGLYKVENLVSVIVALFIFYAGYEIVMDALRSETIELQNVWLSIAGIVCAMAIAFVFSTYERKVGREIGSPSLVADAEHVYIDMFSNFLILLGLSSSFIGFNLDRFAGLIIAAFFAWSGGKIFIDGIKVLLDASLDYDTLRTAEKTIEEEPQVVEIKDLKGRNSGQYKFLEAVITLKTHDLDKAHFISSRIEKNIKNGLKNIDQVLIHYEPSEKEYLIYSLPVEDAEELTISKHFGDAPYFALVTVRAKDNKAVELTTIKNPFTHVEHKKGILAAEYLIKQSVDIFISTESFEGKGPFYVFSDAAVEVLQTEKGSVEQALQEFDITFDLEERGID
ncbi:MAG: cation diffusion facilitator family transporter [Halobacteriota archaeon]